IPRTILSLFSGRIPLLVDEEFYDSEGTSIINIIEYLLFMFLTAVVLFSLTHQKNQSFLS
ncbi:unnamed protein product, partial [Rotaria magnacalcarata]